MPIRTVKFKQDYVNGRAVDMVLLAPTGEGFARTQTWHRVEKLRPPEGLDDRELMSPTYVAMNARWTVIEPAYKAWKSGAEIPETGTPLAAWSGVSPDQAELLKRMGILTVEGVADMGEASLKLPIPNARRLPELARDYLKGADAASKDAELATMRERMEAMEAMLEASTKPAPKQKTDKAEAA